MNSTKFITNLNTKKTNFNFIDLFSGIGGFHLALKKFGGDLVLASEIDKYAIETYKNNFGFDSKLNVKEIKDSDIKSFPRIDVLTAGFPCQTFSIAGNKKGLKDSRGKLIFEVEKIIKKMTFKPKIIILENVKNLITHSNGQIFKIIKQIFIKLGYVTVENPIIISPHQLGVPQHRPRVIIPFILQRNYQKQQILESLEKIRIFGETPNFDIKEYLESNPKEIKPFTIKDKYQLNVFRAWEEFVKNVKRPKNRTLPVIWCDEFAKDYSCSKFSKWKQKYIRDIRSIYSSNKIFIDKWLKKWSVSDWKKRDKKLEWQAGISNYEFKKSFIQLRQSGIRCRSPKMFPALVAMVQIPIIFCQILKKHRYLTPREVANIQNFPHDFKINKNQNQAYKQFGNAVNVYIIEHVFSKLKKFLN